jgi:hypothetical protein
VAQGFADAFGAADVVLVLALFLGQGADLAKRLSASMRRYCRALDMLSARSNTAALKLSA